MDLVKRLQALSPTDRDKALSEIGVALVRYLHEQKAQERARQLKDKQAKAQAKAEQEALIKLRQHLDGMF